MNSSVRKAIGVSCLVFLVIGAVFCFACSKSSTSDKAGGGNAEKQATTGTSNQENGNDELISAREAWEHLSSEMSAWDSGFTIAWVRGGTAAGDSTGRERSWNFYVESADQKRSTYFYFVSAEISGVKQGVTKDEDTPFSTGRDTFDIGSWKIDSTEAVETALAAFKAQKYSDFAGGSKEELSLKSGKLVWEIEFSNRELERDKLQHGTVSVDAQTGEVISVK
jgi:uncharacterized membrane protein YkoI